MLLLELVTLMIYLPWSFLAIPRTEVLLEYLQHLTRRVCFGDYYIVEVTMTPVLDDYIEKRNTVILEQLLKTRISYVGLESL